MHSECSKAAAVTKDKTPRPDQPSLVEVLQKGKPYSFEHPRALKITRYIGEMVAVDAEPFKIVEHTSFSRLMALLGPHYTLPSSKYLSEKLLPSMFEKVRSRVADMIASEKYISYTTDIWSSVSRDSYLSLTVHFITSSFQKKHVCLHTCPFDEQHTGQQIATKLTNCFEQWSVTYKLHAIVRHNGSNFVAGLRDAALPNIPCLAHTLQLVIHDGCFVQRDVRELLAVRRRIVGYYWGKPERAPH